MSQAKHYPSLDGLRGLAILMVIAHNGLSINTEGYGGAVKALYKFLDTGWVGVTLFFALSGFLITGLLLDTQGQPRAWINFTARRALRIFPPYYLFLIVVFVILPALNLQPAAMQEGHDNRIWLWTYLINWAMPMGHSVPSVPHFWSLAIEEQFYVVWPLLVLACRERVQVAMLSLAVAAVSVVVRGWMAHQGGLEVPLYTWTLTRMDALAYGALAACCIRAPTCLAWFDRLRPRLHLAVIALFLLGAGYTHLYPRTSERGFTVGYTILGLCFAYWVFTLVRQDQTVRTIVTAWARWPWLREIGRVSYGMYIVHKPLNDFVLLPAAAAHGLDVTSPARGLLYLLALTLSAYAVAKVSFHAFEQPLLRLKRHFA